MTALRPAPGPSAPGSDWVLMMPSASVVSHLPSPVHRNSAREGEAGTPPDIPGGCVVVLLTRTHHPASKPEERTTMEPRLNLLGNTVTTKFAKYLVSANKAVTDSALPSATQELVKLRASQINGCGVCTDMHTKDAAHAGETQLRLNLVAVWREAMVFTEAERAALELTEQGTRIADAATGVTDEAWANAAKHYDDDQLAALVSLIAEINAWNRLNVITRQPAGDYEPGQWG